MWIPFIFCVYFGYKNILLYAGLIVGYLDAKGFLRFYTDIQNSRCNFTLEKFFWKLESVSYFYYPIENGHTRIAYKEPHSGKEDQQGEIMTEDENSDVEKNKHKYDDINVDDFITRQN